MTKKSCSLNKLVLVLLNILVCTNKQPQYGRDFNFGETKKRKNEQGTC